MAPWAAVALFIGPDLYLLYHILVPSGQGLGRVYTHFSTDRNEVWLTIDDGPDEADTPRILDLLDRHGARATFFVIGRKAALHPDEALLWPGGRRKSDAGGMPWDTTPKRTRFFPSGAPCRFK